MASGPLCFGGGAAQDKNTPSRGTMSTTMPSAVTRTRPAASTLALEHFSADLTFETDCWDVHDALAREPDFVLIDVRSPELYARGHVPGAINIPHAKIIESKLGQYGPETVFVVYCAGPHCN